MRSIVLFARDRRRLARLLGEDHVMIRAQRASDALTRISLFVHEQQSPAFWCLELQGFGGRAFPLPRYARRGAQFIDRKLEPSERANAGDQRDFVDRLGQEIVSAGFETAHAIGRPVERS